MGEWKDKYEERSYAKGYVEGFEEAFKEAYAEEYADSYDEVTAKKRQMEGYDLDSMKKSMQKSMVKKMLKEFSIDVVAETTGFTINEVREYQQKLEAQKKS